MAKPTALPEWASGGSAQITEPSEAQKDLGWAEGDPAPARWMNWWQELCHQWFTWLDARTVEGSTTATLASTRIETDSYFWAAGSAQEGTIQIGPSGFQLAETTSGLLSGSKFLHKGGNLHIPVPKPQYADFTGITVYISGNTGTDDGAQSSAYLYKKAGAGGAQTQIDSTQNNSADGASSFVFNTSFGTHSAGDTYSILITTNRTSDGIDVHDVKTVFDMNRPAHSLGSI